MTRATKGAPLSNNVRNNAGNIPAPVAKVARLMAHFEAPWSLCGGWAVDAWLGRQTRDHGDIDISVFQDDQHVLFEHLSGWQLVGHDPNVPGDTSELWNGRYLDLPGHIHGRPPDAKDGVPDQLPSPSAVGFSLDIQLGERSGDDWVLTREPTVALPVERGIGRSPWGSRLRVRKYCCSSSPGICVIGTERTFVPSCLY